MAINRDVRVDYIGRDRSQGAARSAARGAQAVSQELGRIQTRAVAAQRAFGALTLGFAGNNAVRSLGDLQESLLRVRNLSQDFARDQDFLAASSKRLNLELQSASKSFSDILVLQSTGFISGGQAQDLFIGFQETAKKFGVDAGDVQLALRGLRQAMTAGVVRAQEFDQIFDAIGAIAPSVAKNLGVTTQELLQLRSSATLSSDALLGALIPALREADGSAELASKNINTSLIRLSNSYKTALLEFEKPIGEGVSDFADAGIVAIDGLVEHSDQIALVGTAIAAAYGGRGVAAIGAFTAAQTTSVASSVAHSKALVINNQLLAKQAAQQLNIARDEQASLVQQRQALQVELSQANATRARLAVHAQLQAARAREIAGLTALQAANARAAAATGALTAAQRTASVSTVALTGVTSGLKGALGLVGGPLGAATIALGVFGLEALEASKAVRDVRTANAELNSNLAVIGDRALQDIAGQREAAEVKINLLLERRSKIVSGEISGYERIKDFVGTVEMETASLNLRINQLKTELSDIDFKESTYLNAKRTSDEFEALGNSVARVNNELNKSQGLITKFLPDRAKLKELETALETARASFKPNDADGKAVVSAIEAEIAKLDPLINQRKKYKKEVDDARKSLDALNEALATERERVQATFANAEQTILLNVEVGTIDTGAAVTKIARAREVMSAELEKLDSEDALKLQNTLNEKNRLRDQEIADIQAHRERIAAAQSVIDPAAGEEARFRAEVLALESERSRDLINQQEYFLFTQAAYKAHVAEMKGIADEERERWEDLSDSRQEAILADIGNNFLDSFKQSVGSYITLNENMTAAEQQQADVSNQINKKRFEDNKKFSIAQAAISTYTAAANALRDIPYPFGFAAAAAITASGLRNVSNIRGTSFGSSGGSSAGGGSGGSLSTQNPNEEAATTAQSAQPQNNFVFLGIDKTPTDRERRQIVEYIRQAEDNEEIRFPDGFSVNTVFQEVG